mgnify:FL=1
MCRPTHYNDGTQLSGLPGIDSPANGAGDFAVHGKPGWFSTTANEIELDDSPAWSQRYFFGAKRGDTLSALRQIVGYAFIDALLGQYTHLYGLSIPD